MKSSSANTCDIPQAIKIRIIKKSFRVSVISKLRYRQVVYISRRTPKNQVKCVYVFRWSLEEVEKLYKSARLAGAVEVKELIDRAV